MLEKHHLGQALDLHYNINRKLLKLKGWCEVVQPLASVADRSHLSPHTRRERRGVGRRTFVARLTPRVHAVFFFFFLFYPLFFKCHISTYMQLFHEACRGGCSVRCDLSPGLKGLRGAGLLAAQQRPHNYNVTCFIYRLAPQLWHTRNCTGWK